ncbi:MAG: FtsW/RodA/SpoVE family cell cycle protein [Phycisphaerae bacterium]
MARRDALWRFPWLLMACALALTGLGIAGVYAATAGGEGESFWDTRAAKQLVFLGAALAVFMVALVPSYVRLAKHSYTLYAVSLAALGVLAAFRAGGWEIEGFIYRINYAYSWISIPGVPLKVQPSEIMKIAFLASLAYYLRFRKNYRTLGGLLVPFALALVPTALVLYQPDLGTAMLFLPVLFLMLFAAGARAKHLLAVIAMGLAMVPVFYSTMHGYQRMRIDSWLLHGCAEKVSFAVNRPAETDPSREREFAGTSEGGGARPAAPPPANPLAEAAKTRLATMSDAEKAALVREVTGMWRFRLWRLADALSWGEGKPEFAEAKERLFRVLEEKGPGPESFDRMRLFFGSLLDNYGFQLFQAKVAVGSGGLLGQGWLEGTQTRYGFLPEAHTDFLFPTLAEQFGFLGAATVVVLYGVVCLLGVDVSFSTTEPFGKLLVVGVVSLIAAQSFLNIAMSIGLMPITGIPLPLMSYGGSSLVSSYLALGLLCNVAVRRLYLIAPKPFEWRE